MKDDVVCLIPTWLTAHHALRAANNIRKYYPDIFIYFVDDIVTSKDVIIWQGLNKGGIPDLDSSVLVGYPNSIYLIRKHEGFETEGHGKAVTEAMKSIHAKWVIHLSADCRIIKEGFIEYFLSQANDKTCGVGDDFSRKGPPNLGKWLCVFRGDLYHKYNLNFFGDFKNKLDAGQMYFSTLVDKGYNLQTPKSFKKYHMHLTNVRKDHEDMWDKYYD